MEFGPLLCWFSFAISLPVPLLLLPCLLCSLVNVVVDCLTDYWRVL
jgi:hypothetical protein